MPQQELLRRVIQALEAANIDYMVTGSLASSLQGEPRSTHDIDLLVSVERASVDDLLQGLSSPEFYLDRESILEAIATKSMFNLIDVHEGDKVDFWILTEEPFDKSRFARKYSEEVMGMRWAKLSGGSEKHFTDALRVYEVQFPNLDIQYLNSWSEQLQIRDLWERLQEEAEIP